jgi:hypothetical protein
MPPALTSLGQALTEIFPITRPPRFDYSGVGRGCSDVTVTRPVSYCPAANRIGTDIPAPARRGGPKAGDDPLSAVGPVPVGATPAASAAS